MDATSDSDNATTNLSRLRQWLDKRQAVRQLARDTRIRVASLHSSNVARIALLAGLLVVAVVNFSLSFQGLYDFGRNLSQLPVALAAFVPVGVEGLTVCAIGGIYMMRHAPVRIRGFCWFVFVVPVALSIGGNVSHALSRQLVAPAVVASAFWPILLTLATHLVVVTVRHSERVAVAAQDLSRVATTTTPKPVATATKPETPRLSQPVAGQPERRVATTTSDNKDRDYALRRATDGATVSDIYMELVANGSDTSRRNVERWTKHIRDNLQGATQ
jgi:hypothetical protein